MKLVYATGDSFSFGDELKNPTEDSFPSLIAKELGAMCINTSLCGGSNDRILRKVMTDIPNLLKQHDASDILVLISFSHASRREFFFKDRYLPFWFWAYQRYKDIPAARRLWDLYMVFFASDIEAADRFVSQIISIQFFLKGLNVKYLMTGSMEEPAEMEMLKHPAFHLIDQNRFVKPSFAKFAADRNLPRGIGEHPLEDGHSKWADHLLKFCK